MERASRSCQKDLIVGVSYEHVSSSYKEEYSSRKREARLRIINRMFVLN